MYEQLSRWDEIILQRQTTWKKWKSTLSPINHLRPQLFNNINHSVPFRFAFTSLKALQIVNAFKHKNIPTRGFFVLMHLQPKFKKYSTCSLKAVILFMILSVFTSPSYGQR